MKKWLQFPRVKGLIKVLVVCASFVFPVLCIEYVGGGKVIAFHFIWVAFYSSLLSCVVLKRKEGELYYEKNFAKRHRKTFFITIIPLLTLMVIYMLLPYIDGIVFAEE